MPPIGHSRVGDSIDVFSVGCTDGSAGTYRPASAQKVKLKTWTITQHGYGAKELTVRRAHRWVRQAELEHLKRP